MYSKVGFFAVVLALVGASAATDSVFSDECGSKLCDTCVQNDGCGWFNCTGTLSCLNATLLPENGTCIRANCSAPVVSTTTAPTSTAQPTTEINNINKTRTKPITPTKNGTTGNVTQTTPITPAPHKNTFDAASFIGGIVLILGLQAVFFFIYKFCKSKDRNYHTL
uniref:CD164 molecule, sialomucin n=1 Tax=Gasterosteus aculeatus TaxID=69293 RepID=G3P297_GASAC